MRPVLITAGATRNPIDAIRYISARSSGVTGAELAARLKPGVPVTVLGSAEAVLRCGPGIETVEYGSTRDLMARMEWWVRTTPEGVVVHAAAVGDYESDPSPTKLASGVPELVVRLTPTPKIVDHIRAWSPAVWLASFKACAPGTPSDDVERIARAQLVRTGSDVVFANVIGRIESRVVLIDAGGAQTHVTREGGLDALAARVREASSR